MTSHRSRQSNHSVAYSEDFENESGIESDHYEDSFEAFESDANSMLILGAPIDINAPTAECDIPGSSPAPGEEIDKYNDSPSPAPLEDTIAEDKAFENDCNNDFVEEMGDNVKSIVLNDKSDMDEEDEEAFLDGLGNGDSMDSGVGDDGDSHVSNEELRNIGEAYLDDEDELIIDSVIRNIELEQGAISSSRASTAKSGEIHKEMSADDLLDKYGIDDLIEHLGKDEDERQQKQELLLLAEELNMTEEDQHDILNYQNATKIRKMSPKKKKVTISEPPIPEVDSENTLEPIPENKSIQPARPSDDAGNTSGRRSGNGTAGGRRVSAGSRRSSVNSIGNNRKNSVGSVSSSRRASVVSNVDSVIPSVPNSRKSSRGSRISTRNSSRSSVRRSNDSPSLDPPAVGAGPPVLSLGGSVVSHVAFDQKHNNSILQRELDNALKRVALYASENEALRKRLDHSAIQTEFELMKSVINEQDNCIVNLESENRGLENISRSQGKKLAALHLKGIAEKDRYASPLRIPTHPNNSISSESAELPPQNPKDVQIQILLHRVRKTQAQLQELRARDKKTSATVKKLRKTNESLKGKITTLTGSLNELAMHYNNNITLVQQQLYAKQQGLGEDSLGTDSLVDQFSTVGGVPCNNKFALCEGSSVTGCSVIEGASVALGAHLSSVQDSMTHSGVVAKLKHDIQQLQGIVDRQRVAHAKQISTMRTSLLHCQESKMKIQEDFLLQEKQIKQQV